MFRLDNKIKSAMNRIDNVFFDWDLDKSIEVMGLYISLRRGMDDTVGELNRAADLKDTEEIEVTATEIKPCNVSGKLVAKKEAKQLRRKAYDKIQADRRKDYEEKVIEEKKMAVERAARAKIEAEKAASG